MKKRLLFALLLVGMCILSFAAETSMQGIAYYKAGFPSIAKPQLIEEIQVNPTKSSDACFYLGNVYFIDEQADSAAIAFNKGIAQDAENALNYIGLAMLKIKSDAKSADAEIQKALRIKNSAKNVDVLIAIANAYLMNKDVANAEVYFEKAKKLKAKYAPVSVLMGDILVDKNQIGEACSNYEQAILFDNKCKEAYIKYARAYRVVNTPLAIEMLNKLKAKEPSFLLADREMADIYYATAKYDKAAEWYESYIKSGNANEKDLIQYAMTLFLKGDFEKSIEIASKGVKKSPRSPGFNRLMMYDNVSLKKYDEALVAADLLFNKCDKPKFIFFDYTYYALALKSVKKYDEAAVEYKKALKLDSTKCEIQKELSDLYGERKDYAGAVTSYEKYISCLPAEKQTSDLKMTLGKLCYTQGTDTAKTVAQEIKTAALVKADTLFAQISKVETDYRSNFWRARTNSALDPETSQGLAKPYYELTSKTIEEKKDTRYNKVLIECYRYLGYYSFLKSDNTQALEFFNKVLALDPNDPTSLKAIDGIKSGKKKK